MQKIILRKKMTERSDYLKYSIFNLQSSLFNGKSDPAPTMSGVYRLVESRFICELFWKL